MNRRILPGLAALILCLSALTVYADENELLEMSIEELLNVNVEVGSKKQEKVSEAPGVITVVTRKEIEAFGAVSLVDVLNRVPGLQIMTSHLWVQSKSVLRGDLITHADNHILVLINGRPFRDANENNSNYTVYNAFPLDMIERIEIINGPGSVLYGSSAVAGVINIITREPVDQFSAKVTGGGGAYGGKLGSLSAMGSVKDLKVAIGANYFHEDGWNLKATTAPPGAPLITDDLDYSEFNRSVGTTIEYKRLKAELYMSHIIYDSMGAIPYWVTQGSVEGQRVFADVGYTQPITGTWKLDFNVTQNGLRQRIDSVANNEWNNTDATIYEAALSGKITDVTNLVMGGLTEIRNNNTSDPGTTLPVNFRETLYSAYAQLDHQLIKPLKVIAGAQYNQIDSGESRTVPRGGLIYSFSDAVSLKLQYAQAFRGPTPLEEYIDAPNILAGNEDLVPEIVTTYDAQLLINTPRTQYSLSAFHSRYKDLVDRVDVAPAPTQTFDNLGRLTIRGAEFEAKARLTDTFFATGSFTYQDETDEIIYIPTYMAKVGLTEQWKGLTIGVFNSLFAKPLDNNGAVLNDKAAPINLLSANITYRFDLFTPIELNVFGSNLLDNDMMYTEFSKGWFNTLPIGPGRSVYARLSVEI